MTTKTRRQIPVSLDEATITELDRLAANADRSRAGMIRFLLACGIADSETDESIKAQYARLEAYRLRKSTPLAVPAPPAPTLSDAFRAATLDLIEKKKQWRAEGKPLPYDP